MKKALADKKKMEDNEYGFQSWADEEEGYEQQEENPVYQSILKGHELEAYANKFGGVDKKDMMKVAAMLKRGDKSGALKYAKTLDTDPKEYILNLLGEEVELDEGRTSDIHLEIQDMIEDGKSDEEISKVTGFSVKDIKSVRRQVSMEENEQIDLDQGHIDTIKEHAGLRSTAKSNFGINVGEEGYRPVSSTDLSKWAKLFN